MSSSEVSGGTTTVTLVFTTESFNGVDIYVVGKSLVSSLMSICFCNGRIIVEAVSVVAFPKALGGKGESSGGNESLDRN